MSLRIIKVYPDLYPLFFFLVSSFIIIVVQDS